MLELRDYQKECLTALGAGSRRGLKRMLVAMATGSGKTVIFSQLPSLIKNGRRMLVVAHREELLDQAAEKISWANPDLIVDVEQAQRHASPMARVVVASIQTLAVSPKRLEALNPESFAVVVVDEAHHSTANSYLNLMTRLGLGPAIDDLNHLSDKEKKKGFAAFIPDAKAPALIGFTATPNRTDGIGLGAIFDEIVYSKTIEEMMRAGWLCKIIGKRVQTTADISGVKTSHGDYQEASLSAAVNLEVRNDLIVKSYLALAAGRPALVFCVDVNHAESVAAAFQDASIAAKCIVGETPKDERRDMLADYRAGRIPVLCNCMVLTEGFDAPETSCIILARPTKSSLLYTQMIGRGTRIAPGKDHLLVIDLVDAGAAGLGSLNTLFGLPPALEFSEDVLAAKDELGEFDLIPEEDLAQARTIEEVKKLARDFDPLRRAKPPDSLQRELAWVRTSYGYALTFKGGRIEVVENMLEQATVLVKTQDAKTYVQQSYARGRYPSAQAAVTAAERFIQENYPDQVFLLQRKAKWRTSKETASEKQLAFLVKLKVQHPVYLTKSQAGELISNALAERGRR